MQRLGGKLLQQPNLYQLQIYIYKLQLLGLCSTALSSLGRVFTLQPTANSTLTSQSHIMTDNQSVSKSWIRAPCGSRDRPLISVWHLWEPQRKQQFLRVLRCLATVVNNVSTVDCWPTACTSQYLCHFKFKNIAHQTYITQYTVLHMLTLIIL
jgi:hypothetical protein